MFFDAPEDVMHASRRERGDRLGVAGHTTSEWDEHFETYQLDVLPLHEHADIVVILRASRSRAGAQVVHGCGVEQQLDAPVDT